MGRGRATALSNPADYEQRAAECLRLAQEVRDRTNKVILLEMARTWIRLAEQEHASASSTKSTRS
jgi:hypothetical protein